jgi:hypothetical protein
VIVWVGFVEVAVGEAEDSMEADDARVLASGRYALGWVELIVTEAAEVDGEDCTTEAVDDSGIALEKLTLLLIPTAFALIPLVAEAAAVPFHTTGQETTSTFKLAGTQLHMRKMLPFREGRLLLVVPAASTIWPKMEAASALIVKALIWRET